MQTISISKRSLFSLVSLAALCCGSLGSAQKLGERKPVKPPQIATPAVIACGGDHAVKRVSPKGAMTPIGAHSDKATALALVPDVQGSLVVSGDASGVIKVWNAAYSRLLLEQKAHDKAVTGLAVSTDGKTIATVGEEGKLRLWERATGKKQFETQGVAGALPALFYAPDGKTLYACAPSQLLSWRVVNLLNGARRLYPEPNQDFGAIQANAAVLSPDGTRIALGCEDAHIRIWNIAAKREERAVRASEFPLSAVAWTSEGRWIAAGDVQGNIRVWEIATGEGRPFLCRAGAAVRGLGFGLNAHVLVGATSKGTLLFWEANGGALISQKPLHQNGIARLIVLP